MTHLLCGRFGWKMEKKDIQNLIKDTSSSLDKTHSRGARVL